MHWYFLFRAIAMNPNMREEVSIIFSAAVIVDWGREDGDTGRLWWIYCPSNSEGLLPLFSLPLKQHGLLLEVKLAKWDRCSVLEPLFVLTVISSRERWDRNLLECVEPFSRSMFSSRQQGKSLQTASWGLLCPFLLPRGLFLQLFRVVCVYWNTTEHLSRACHWLMTNVSDNNNIPNPLIQERMHLRYRKYVLSTYVTARAGHVRVAQLAVLFM